MASWRWVCVGFVMSLAAAYGACSSSSDSGSTTASTGASAPSGGGGTSGAGGSPSGAGGTFMCNDAGVAGSAMGPTVQIISPTPGQVFKTTDIVPLKGTATDPVDGSITSPLQTFWFLEN